MKRNMDLIREILLYIESNQIDVNSIDITLQNYSEYEITYHLKLLSEAGLVEINNSYENGAGINTNANRLTWSGHDFIESAKEPKRWESMKKIITEKAGSVPFEILQKILIKLIQGEINL